MIRLIAWLIFCSAVARSVPYVNVAEMIAAARAAGKVGLVDPKGDDCTPSRGATMLTPNKSELKRVVGSWSSEAQLTAKAQALRAELRGTDTD